MKEKQSADGLRLDSEEEGISELEKKANEKYLNWKREKKYILRKWQEYVWNTESLWSFLISNSLRYERFRVQK